MELRFVLDYEESFDVAAEPYEASGGVTGLGGELVDLGCLDEGLTWPTYYADILNEP